MHWQFISSDTAVQSTAAILQHGCTPAPTFHGVPLYLLPSSLLRSICLSEHHPLKNLLRLAEIHTSCLTARCHVYPGRSVLGNLQPPGPVCTLRHGCKRRRGRRDDAEWTQPENVQCWGVYKAGVHTGDLVALAEYLRHARRPLGLIILKGVSNECSTLFTTACLIDWSTAVPKMSQASLMFGGSICLMYHRDSQQQQTRSQGKKKKSIKHCISSRLGFISFHGLS